MPSWAELSLVCDWKKGRRWRFLASVSSSELKPFCFSPLFIYCANSCEMIVIFQVPWANPYCSQSMGAFRDENVNNQAFLYSRGARMVLTADSQSACAVPSAAERVLNCSTGKIATKKILMCEITWTRHSKSKHTKSWIVVMFGSWDNMP